MMPPAASSAAAAQIRLIIATSNVTLITSAGGYASAAARGDACDVVDLAHAAAPAAAGRREVQRGRLGLAHQPADEPPVGLVAAPPAAAAGADDLADRVVPDPQVRRAEALLQLADRAR